MKHMAGHAQLDYRAAKECLDYFSGTEQKEMVYDAGRYRIVRS